MKVSHKKIKQARLANNCPECFSQDSLIITFYQKHLKNPFYQRATSEISDTLVCDKCNTTIYPIRWTDDIERVHEFYSRSVETKTFFKLSKQSYILLLLAIVVIITATILIKTGVIG